MRVVRISDHLIVRAVRYDPLILAILYFEFIDELGLEVVRIFANEILGPIAELAHFLCMISTAFMLCKSILVFALFLTHFTVVFVLA